MITTTDLADILVELADTLVSDFDLIDLFDTLTSHAQNLSGADTAGLVLVDNHDVLQFMSAANDAGRFLELFQLQQSEGPCRDAYLTGKPVVNRDLGTAEDAWATFAPAARAAGFQSVHAFPMRLRDQTIGALNLFSRERAPFSAAEVRIVQSLADIATIAILQHRGLNQAEILATQLQNALTSRVVIEQAKGFLSRSEGISLDEAFTILRRRARTNQRRLADVAAEALESSPTPTRAVPIPKPAPPRSAPPADR